MKLEFVSGSLDQLETTCLVVFAQNNGNLLNGTPAMQEALMPFVSSGEFGKDFGDSFYMPSVAGVAAKRVLFFNVGESIKREDDYRRAAARAWKLLRGRSVLSPAVSLAQLESEAACRAVVEGFVLGSYLFTQFKSEKDKQPKALEGLKLHQSGARDLRTQVETWVAIAGGTARARDLCQMPSNYLTPTRMAELAEGWGHEFGYTTSIMGEDQLREEGFGSMLSVSQGSEQEGKFIIMDYQPGGESQKTIVLVGKGVTFDTGGISLKPAAGMSEMKGDMGGAAAVIGTMTVLKAANCPFRVVGLVPAVENMPSGKATKPSDVVTSLAGLTIEVNNTDAEGRLILVDALTYAKRYNPDFVIDYATLTGACLVALGTKVCAVMGNNELLVQNILKAGKEVHELFWELPLVDEYKALLKSDTADISNVSKSRWGGTITAGLFLQRFADSFQWAHCDIAPAIFEKAEDYHPSGGTGIGVRMTARLLELLG